MAASASLLPFLRPPAGLVPGEPDSSRMGCEATGGVRASFSGDVEGESAASAAAAAARVLRRVVRAGVDMAHWLTDSSCEGAQLLA